MSEVELGPVQARTLIRKHFCANPYASKAQVIQCCIQRGFSLPLKPDGEYDDNVADSVAVAVVTQEQWKLDQLAGVGKPSQRRKRA